MADVFLKLMLLLLVSLASGTESEVKEESKDPLARAFAKLPEEEKNDFLRYFLALGMKDWEAEQKRPPKIFSSNEEEFIAKRLNISDKNLDKFKAMKIPKESRIQLLQWTKKEFGLTTKNMYDMLKNRNCAGNHCSRLPDIGSLCCPW